MTINAGRGVVRSARGGGAGFRPDIEGLRAIAVALVALCHARVPGARRWVHRGRRLLCDFGFLDHVAAAAQLGATFCRCPAPGFLRSTGAALATGGDGHRDADRRCELMTIAIAAARAVPTGLEVAHSSGGSEIQAGRGGASRDRSLARGAVSRGYSAVQRRLHRRRCLLRHLGLRHHGSAAPRARDVRPDEPHVVLCPPVPPDPSGRITRRRGDSAGHVPLARLHPRRRGRSGRPFCGVVLCQLPFHLPPHELPDGAATSVALAKPLVALGRGAVLRRVSGVLHPARGVLGPFRASRQACGRLDGRDRNVARLVDLPDVDERECGVLFALHPRLGTGAWCARRCRNEASRVARRTLQRR